MSSDKSDVGSNVKVAGLLGMGVTLILIGLSLLPSPYGAGFQPAFGGAANAFWVAVSTAGTFGGIVLVLLGLIALYKGHQFWGSAFVSYGAFFSIWTVTATLRLAQVQYYGLAGFVFVFMLMTLTFLISSMKHGWLAFFLYLFFFFSTVLWIVLYWMMAAGNNVSNGQMYANAVITIITGLIAWYTATAQLTNWTYGRKVIPG